MKKILLIISFLTFAINGGTNTVNKDKILQDLIESKPEVQPSLMETTTKQKELVKDKQEPVEIKSIEKKDIKEIEPVKAEELKIKGTVEAEKNVSEAMPVEPSVLKEEKKEAEPIKKIEVEKEKPTKEEVDLEQLIATILAESEKEEATKAIDGEKKPEESISKKNEAKDQDEETDDEESFEIDEILT